MLVKDNLDVAGLPTTAGNVALQNSIPDRDSTVVAKLRAAGAVILGKTNLTEFANFMTNGMPNGYSSPRRPGAQPVRHRPRHERLVAPARAPRPPRASRAITIGTETSGSIVIARRRSRASSACGPTVGLVSRTGILPISASQDTAGPMTRTVADAAAELQAIAGKDAEDPATANAPATVPNYLAGLSPTALAGKRIGVINNTNAQYVAAIAAIQALGATTVQIPTPSPAAELQRDPHRGVQARPQRVPRRGCPRARR